MQNHITRAQFRHQRRVPVQRLKVPGLRRQINRVRQNLKESALRRHQPNPQLICRLCHGLLSAASNKGHKDVGTRE